MMYYYEIDKKGNFILSGHDIHEHAVTLNEFQVKFLKKVLENKMLNIFLKQSDYLRGALEAEDGIDLETHYRLVKALVNRSFETDFEIEEPKFYVHVLAGEYGYLNVLPGNKPFLNSNEEWDDLKTKFTKFEIEGIKYDERFKGINFDACLERVEEDD